jgi:hypothetical protein
MRGVKDSLITFSAVGAAGLLAYYSLSNPSTINEPKNLVKRSFEGFADSAAQDGSFYEDFCLDDDSACQSMDDVLMFADDDYCDDPKNADKDECLGPDARAGRGKKRKRKPAASADAPVENGSGASDWIKTAEGKEALDKKMETAIKQIEKIHRSSPPTNVAQLPEDALPLTLGDAMVSEGTSQLMAELADGGGADCSFGAANRVSNTLFYALFPEDIMYDSDADQSALHGGYMAFADQLASFAGGSINVGTYASNNLVNLVPYAAGWNDYYQEFNVPAKKNRQGSYNLGASMPNIGKIVANTWKKVQREVKRSMDWAPGSPTCQIFLFLHNVPFEYKNIANDQFEVASNLRSRCNIVPVMVAGANTQEAMTNVAARWNGLGNQEYTAVEPAFRGYVNADNSDFASYARNVADGLMSWSCLSEQRAACRVKRSAWFAPLDEFRGIEEEVDINEAYPTTGTTTTEWYSETTEWSTTTDGFIEEDGEPMIVDMRCCGADGGAGLTAGTYDQNAESCCRQDDGSFGSC